MMPLTVVDRFFPPTVIVFEPRKKLPEPSKEPAVVPTVASGEKSTAPVPFAISRAVPPEDVPKKLVVPPLLFVIVALAAEVALKKRISELFVMVALPAVLLSVKLSEALLLF